MVLHCAFIKAPRTGRVVYNDALRLVKLTRRKCLCREGFIHRFAHKFSRGGQAGAMVNDHPRSRFRRTSNDQNTKFRVAFPREAHKILVSSNGFRPGAPLMGALSGQGFNRWVQIPAAAFGF